MRGRIVRVQHWPAPLAFFVALAFGRRLRVLEMRTLYKRGKRLARAGLAL